MTRELASCALPSPPEPLDTPAPRRVLARPHTPALAGPIGSVPSYTQGEQHTITAEHSAKPDASRRRTAR